jgi:hypothetical protein
MKDIQLEYSKEDGYEAGTGLRVEDEMCRKRTAVLIAPPLRAAVLGGDQY